MLLTQLAAVLYITFTFIVRAPQVSTSLALIFSLAKLPLLSNQPYDPTDFDAHPTYSPSLSKPSDVSDFPSHQPFPVLLEFQPQHVCQLNSSETVFSLVPEVFCSIHDESTSDTPLAHVLLADLFVHYFHRSFLTINRLLYRLITHKRFYPEILFFLFTSVFAFVMSHPVSILLAICLHDEHMPL
jgi:hypothetical protein